MVKVIKENTIFEMARIGYTPDRLEIIIYTDDGGYIPHFHVFDRNLDVDNECCIRIDRPEYFRHGNKDYRLNNKQKKSLVDFLNTKHKMLKCTNWEHLVVLWNDNNSNIVFTNTIQMPNYMNLK